MGDKLEETEDGYYVQSGDIREWKWKPGKGPKPPEIPTVEEVVAEPEPEPKPKTTKKAKDE